MVREKSGLLKRRSIGVIAVLAASFSAPALAHPHIFVDAKATVVFDDAGQVVGVRNSWTFDEAYSSWSVQGLDTNLDGKVSRDETQELADENLTGLREYGFYTFAGEGDVSLHFPNGSNPAIDYAEGLQVLSFDVAPERPYMIKDTLALAIADPEYYVAIVLPSAAAVTLENAPANCTTSLREPVPLPDDVAARLYDLPPDVTVLPEDLARALRDTQGAVLIHCPGGSATGKPIPAVAEPSTAVDAAKALAEASPVTNAGPPLGGPPPEPGLALPRTGFLGWVAQQQADFYQALVKALDALRTDWTAFWVLGGLSFLYGVFHAAGPGHGKVVISSYVLANEAQVRRGVLLSFLSAMLQSLVAIGFVLIAAAMLGLSSMAMNDAAHWIGVVSYALIVGLGAWLVLRKVLRLGHQHGHDHAAPKAAMRDLARERLGMGNALSATRMPVVEIGRPQGPDAHGRLPGHAHYGHDHGDEDGHDHHGHAHVVTADQIRGGWREQLGVVLAVGMRPCSGALIVLAFALSQGLLLAGIIAVLLMGLGTALTTGVLAALAVGAKGLAQRLAGTDNRFTGTVLWWVELLAAFAVFGFGLVLLLASL